MKGKKIGILTQPLKQNYGGLLQAYVLQTVLKRMGYTPIIIDRHKVSPKWRRLASHIKTLLLKGVGRGRSFTYWPSQHEESLMAHHTDYFINKYIQPKSKRLYTNKELLDYVAQQKMDAFVVGSDQVWRPRYSPHLPTYFLDFLEDNKEVKKIAYAASFGVDAWEFSKSETRMAKRLAPLFDAISVREDSGVSLCKEYLKVDAQHVLDPTLLLAKEDYIALFEAEKEPRSEGDLFTYILDATAEKSEMIAQIANELSLTPFAVQAKTNQRSRKNYKHHIDDLIVPPVTKWLRAFYDAKFVVTDSFHGCVFSILFNKPFIAIGNHDRGLARFNSLLSSFGLANRLFFGDSTCSDMKQVVKSKIDWDSVNSNLTNKKEYSLSFIKENMYEE